MHQFKLWLANKCIDFVIRLAEIKLAPEDELNLAEFWGDPGMRASFQKMMLKRRQEIQAVHMGSNTVREIDFFKGRYFENINLEKELIKNHKRYEKQHKSDS